MQLPEYSLAVFKVPKMLPERSAKQALNAFGNLLLTYHSQQAADHLKRFCLVDLKNFLALSLSLCTLSALRQC